MSGCVQTEANRCAKFIGPGSGKMQPACFLFPAFSLVLFFHRRPRSYCAKQARLRFGFGWPCQVVAKQIRSGSKLMCKNHRAWFWQNRTGPVLAKRNQPESDLSLDGHVRLWPNGSGLEASRYARIIMPVSGKTELAQFWQNATGPVLAKRDWPRSDLVLDGHVRLWPNGSDPEASWCARIIRLGSSQPLPGRILTISGLVPACLLGLSFAC